MAGSEARTLGASTIPGVQDDPQPDAHHDDHPDDLTPTDDEWAWLRLGALWPTVIPRPTRTQWLSLVLISLLSLGPILALMVLVRSDVSPIAELADEPGTPPGGAHVVITAINISATTGELRIRALVQPDPATLRNGRPQQDLVLAVNDVRGQSTAVFPAGQPIVPAEFTLGLEDGSVRQFPFDSYTTPIVTVLSEQTGDTTTVLPVHLELKSSVDGFAVQGNVTAIDQPDQAAVRQAELDAARSTSTIVYVVWIMTLMYGLAISGVLLLWSVMIRRIEVPLWSFGLFVGVLFALPPLRLALPGNPPLGVLVDFVSFYWAVTIVGITLLWLVAVGIRQSRAAAEQRRAAEERHHHEAEQPPARSGTDRS